VPSSIDVANNKELVYDLLFKAASETS